MNINIDKYDITRMLTVVGIIAMGVFIWWSVAGVMSGQKRESNCERSCGKYKATMVEGSCHCAINVGWVKPGQAEWIQKKISQRCRK